MGLNENSANLISCYAVFTTVHIGLYSVDLVNSTYLVAKV